MNDRPDMDHAGNPADENREFLRVEHERPLNFKVLRDDRYISKTDISSRNISASGLLFRTDRESSIPAISSIVWIELDERMVSICSEIEHDLVIHNNGIYGRVVRIAEGEPGHSYDIGICFLRKSNMEREEVESLMTDQ